MAGADKCNLEPNKTQVEPAVPNQTTDFSVSTNAGISDPNAASIDVYSTQFADRKMRSETIDPASIASSASISIKNDFPSDIPGFIVESELGRGAFGVVYCARDELLDRRVAIKRPLINNTAHRQQYIDEARKAVKLDHPSIVPIYQVGMTTNDEPFVVQKLIEGSTLREMLQKCDSRLPLLQTVAIMRQVCLAVNAAHTAGIVHRDLKPENLLVEPEGRVYVADFGLAILEDDEQNRKGREVAGTPLYMSPEQFAGRVEWLDGRSDIWALGVILYELLSGKTPFTGTTLKELRDQINNKDPRPIHQRDPKVPSAFDALFRKCCAKNVGDRFASVREMIAELDAITESLPFLETINLMSQSRTSSFSAMSSSFGSALSSAADSRQVGLTSRGSSTLGSDGTTIRNSVGGITIRKPSTLWKLAVPSLMTLAIFGTLTCVAWIAKLGPFAVIIESPTHSNLIFNSGNSELRPVEKRDSAGVLSGELGITDKKPAEPIVDPKPLPPSKPFFVAINGKGTHDSIAKAIADSASGDTVTILAGTYRESFVIDRSIQLVGEGAVKILSTEQACVKILADSQVVIERVTFDSQAAKFNAIDIVGGRLELKRCEVFASSNESYNCVKARANATFVAEHCKFQTTLDVAVSGEKTSSITIRDSTFNFSGNSDSVLKRIGVQGTGAVGLIQDCVFTGPCIGGIDWRDSPDRELTIEGCEFDNCDIGIQIRACNTVVIKGSVDRPCEIRNAAWGLSIKESQVDLSRVNVEGIGDKNRVAMQITENSKVKCTDCDFFGTVCGVLVKRSSLLIDNVSIRDTGFMGLLVDGGSVDGNELNLLNVANYGLAVLSKGATVKLNALIVEAAPAIPPKIRLTPAVYVASGKVEFTEGFFSGCVCGIFVDPKRTIINSTGFPESRSLVELIGDPKKIEMTLSPVELISDRMNLTNCDLGWIFNGIGSSRIKELGGVLLESHRVPKLTDTDLKLDGTDYSNFSVLKKTGSN